MAAVSCCTDAGRDAGRGKLGRIIIPPDREQLDDGLGLHGSLLLFIYCFIFFVRPVTYSAIGVFLVEFTEYFANTTGQQTAWIGGCQLGIVSLLSSMPIGYLLNRFGARIVVALSAATGSVGLLYSGLSNDMISVYIGYGIMLGWCSISYQIIGSVLIQTTFNKRRNLFAGIAYTCMSAGAFVWPAVARILIDAYSWQGAFLVLAAINLNVLAFSRLLPSTSRINQQVTTEKVIPDEALTEINDRAADREQLEKSGDCIAQETHVTSGGKGNGGPLCGRPSYVFLAFYCVGQFFNQLALFETFMYFPLRCKEEGYSKQEAVFVVSLMSIAGCVFRTPAGALGDIRRINVCFLSAAANFVMGLSCLFSTLATTIASLITCGCFIGGGTAFYIGLMNSCVEYVVGRHRLHVGFSMLNTTQGLCLIVGLPLSGFFLDHLGTTRSLFVCLGSANLLGGVVNLAIGVLRRSAYCYANSNPSRKQTL